jgi:hypothetical protein
MTSAIRQVPPDESSHARTVRPYKGIKHPATPSAALSSWPRGSVICEGQAVA